MNEWEKEQKKDCEYYSNHKPEYTVKFEYADTGIWDWPPRPKSRWSRFKNTIKRWLVTAFISSPKMGYESIKMLFSRKCCNKTDIEQLKHDLDMANARIVVLEFANRQLESHANNAWDTLAAYRKLEDDAVAEQAQKKKAAKKRPSSKKKRKG